MSGRALLTLIVVALVVGLVWGLISGFLGWPETPWWYFAILGGLVAIITSLWEVRSRRKKASIQTGVEEEASEPQQKPDPPTG